MSDNIPSVQSKRLSRRKMLVVAAGVTSTAGCLSDSDSSTSESTPTSVPDESPTPTSSDTPTDSGTMTPEPSSTNTPEKNTTPKNTRGTPIPFTVYGTHRYRYSLTNQATVDKALGARTGLTKSWETRVGSDVTTPLVDKGFAYVGSDNSTIVSLDTSDGSTVWETSVPSTIKSPTPIVGNIVYAAGQDGILTALNAQNGDNLWEVRLEESVESAPLISRSTVYIGTLDGSLYALDRKNGRKRWQYNTPGPVSAKPAYHAGSGTLYATTGDGFVVAINEESGESVWEYDIEAGGIVTPPVFDVEDQLIYVADDQSTVYGLRTGEVGRSDSREKWQSEIQESITAPVAASSNRVIVATTGKKLYSLLISDGTIEWETRVAGGFDTSPVIGDQIVYIPHQDTAAKVGFSLFDIQNGEQLLFVRTGTSVRTNITILNNRVLFADNLGLVSSYIPN